MTSFLRIIAALVFVVLMVLLLGPALALEAQRPGIDKVAHFGAFGLMLWSFGVLFPRVSRVRLAAVAMGIGISTEIIQGLTGRDAEVLDAVADGLGILTALLAWSVWRGFRPRRSLSHIRSNLVIRK